MADGDFSYRYLLPVPPFAFPVGALAFAPVPMDEKPDETGALTLPEKPVTPSVFHQPIS